MLAHIIIWLFFMKHSLNPISNSLLNAFYTGTFSVTNHDLNVNRMELFTTTLTHDEDYEVTKLCFSESKMSMAAIQALSTFFTTVAATEIQELHINAANFDDNSLKILANGLVHSQLQLLDLRYNYIKAEGAQILADLLPETPIKALFLGHNHIKDEGAEIIGDILPNSNVEIIDLGSNDITDAGVNELARILPDTDIIGLSLDKNTIGDLGAIFLAQELPGTNIKILSLKECYIGDHGAKEIAGCLPHTNISILNLGSNFIGDHVVGQFTQICLPEQLIDLSNLHNNGHHVAIIGGVYHTDES
ncbi:leucine-rich repeat domain-containing protein [Candidatus Trichorickettsia mobilis]|uniref:hypothetical protein n=1 Tax=Candidatus Trichorickettsia mobilis TaxID=1346319 RepID=UPI00292E7819|nr:hypothetical protein [Candidatus Trichorickettsia mobilis]